MKTIKLPNLKFEWLPLSCMLEKSMTKLELFAVAKRIGASCDAIKSATADNIAKELCKPERKLIATLILNHK